MNVCECSSPSSMSQGQPSASAPQKRWPGREKPRGPPEVGPWSLPGTRANEGRCRLKCTLLWWAHRCGSQQHRQQNDNHTNVSPLLNHWQDVVSDGLSVLIGGRSWAREKPSLQARHTPCARPVPGPSGGSGLVLTLILPSASQDAW